MSKELATTALSDLSFVAFTSFGDARRFMESAMMTEKAVEEARLKTLTETSCLAYQLTKIPVIRAVVEGKGCREELFKLLRATAVNATEEELKEMVELRLKLFQESLEDRALGGSSLVWQTEEWVWDKVTNEEILELSSEAGTCRGDLKPEIDQKVGEICFHAFSGEREVPVMLGKIFELARLLGVKNELNLFRFITAKQEGRIASGKDALAGGKERQLAEKYFC